MDSITRALKKLTRLRENLQDLTEVEAYEVFKKVLEGEISDVKTTAFLTGMRIKGETAEELLGVKKAIEESMRRPARREKSIDLATNYDGKNRSIYILPSALWLCSELGIEFTNHFALRTPTKEGVTLYEVVSSIAANINICFSDQKDYAPELHKLMPLRRELGFRSLINTVEKFLNPFGATRTLVSVFHRPYFKKNQELLELLGFEDYTIIKGLEGGLEPFPDRPTMIKRRGKDIEIVDPRDIGLDLPKDVRTENVLESSIEVNRRIIQGMDKGGLFNWAVYTAGVILYAAGEVGNVREGVDKIVATKL